MAEWLSRSGPAPKPVMTLDKVEAIKSLVAVGLGASILPSLCLGDGHVPMPKHRCRAALAAYRPQGEVLWPIESHLPPSPQAGRGTSVRVAKAHHRLPPSARFIIARFKPAIE
jgi:DNA-binding transcriptional LysR family regulator